MVTRRAFLQAAAARWPGSYLIHEHVLVDFIGAEQANPSRYDADEVFRVALPHLKALYERGCRTLAECTPAYLGRDPLLLARLARASGLRIFTNTGYYGAAKDKHLPAHAFEETAAQLAGRWTREYREGIGGTRVKPAFIKTGVDPGPLSPVDRKLIEASALCHKQTGLRIHAHTGDGQAAMEILDVLQARGVRGDAYVWVHAQNEKDQRVHERAARMGAWIEFDGINEKRAEDHLRAVASMIEAGFLRQLLISQDSGWYRVGEAGGGRFNGYTYLFDSFVPALRERGVNEAAIHALLIGNPKRVLHG